MNIPDLFYEEKSDPEDEDEFLSAQQLPSPVEQNALFEDEVPTSIDKMSSIPRLSGHLKFCIIVECVSESAQAELLTRFEKEGMKCRLLITL